jgi:ATP-dependent exoDNAse (exonuclease V) alpha subunit
VTDAGRHDAHPERPDLPILYREAAYVALSRGRANNRMYLVERADESEQHAALAAEPDPYDVLAAALRVSRAQRLAVDHGTPEPARFEIEL